MGPRGFRVSLAQTAAKEDYIRGSSIITSAIIDEYCATVERGKAKDAPPGREGYCLMWSVLGCAAGQGMIFLVSVPKHGIKFYARFPQPGMVSTIDIRFRFSVLNRVRVSNSQRHLTPKHWSKDPVLSPPPPPGAEGHRSSATLQNLD